MTSTHRLFHSFWVLVVALALSACTTINISPDSSPKILTDSHTTLTEGLVLLGSMEGGVKQDTYSEREENFNQLIAKMETLVTLIETRPPGSDLDSKQVDVVIEFFNKKKIPMTKEDLQHPDLQAANNALKQLKFLRDIDKNQDCVSGSNLCPNGDHVKPAKTGFKNSMSAVIFYEQLLIDTKGD